MRSLEKVKISGAQPYLQSTLELHDCPGEHQRVLQFSGVLQRVHYSPDKIKLADVAIHWGENLGRWVKLCKLTSLSPALCLIYG